MAERGWASEEGRREELLKDLDHTEEVSHLLIGSEGGWVAFSTLKVTEQENKLGSLLKYRFLGLTDSDSEPAIF